MSQYIPKDVWKIILKKAESNRLTPDLKAKIMDFVKECIWKLMTTSSNDWRTYGVSDNIYQNTKGFDDYLSVVAEDIYTQRRKWYNEFDDDEKEELVFEFRLDEFIPVLSTLHPDTFDDYQTNFELFCRNHIDVLLKAH